jgi:hypothetical protein
MLRADCVLMHPGDDRGAAGRADRCRGERIRVPHRLLRETVERWRSCERIAIRAEPRAHVLRGDPDNIPPRRLTRRRLRRNGWSDAHEHDDRGQQRTSDEEVHV